MIYLLDTSVLIALAWTAHPDHRRATRWFAVVNQFATCPITQLGFLRVSTIATPGYASVADARTWLQILTRSVGHNFWQDTLSFEELLEVRGPQQWTDTYLAALAGKNAGQLATLDRGVSRLPGVDPGWVKLI